MNKRGIAYVTAVAIIALLLVVLPVTGGCAPKVVAPESGAPTVARIGGLCDLTGPYAATTGPLALAFKDAAVYVNEERDGIAGVPLEPIVFDTEAKPELAISHYAELRAMEPRPWVIMADTPSGAAIRDRLIEDKIVGLTSTTMSVIYPRAWFFSFYNLNRDGAAAAMDWIMKTNPTKNKVALLVWDVSFGKDALCDEVRNYAKSKGIIITDEETFGIRDVDVSTQLTKIKQNNPDWIITALTAGGAAVIAKSMQALGWEVPVIGTFDPCIDRGAYLVGGSILDGFYNIRCHASYDEDNVEGIKVIKKYLQRFNRREQDKTYFYLNAFWQVAFLEEAMERTLKMAGGDWSKMTTEGLKEQVSKMGGYNPLGLGVCSYTPSRVTLSTVRMYRLGDGKILPVSDYMDCPDMRPEQFK